ncbi:MAG: MCE family protein [Aeromicrobium sp.]|uniref:MCE family protein n=1 Tax=Aeromicrobium sp. TaxID=1871063 RepID=UPI0039E452CD
MSTSRIARLLALALLLPLLGGCLTQSDKKITLQFEDATGLFRGNDVGIRGVPVGEVTKITPSGDHVNVEIVIHDDVKLPQDVGAVVVSRSVATDRYIEMTPAYVSGPEIKDGATIGVDRTKTPVEFEELLETLENLSGALGAPEGAPEGTKGPLHDLLAASAANFEGRGAQINSTLSDLADVLVALTGMTPAVETNLTNIDQLTATLASHDALIRDFSTNVTNAVVMLDGQSAQIESTFDALAAMLQAVADLSAQHKVELGSQMEDFVALSNELMAHEEQITQLLEAGPLLTQNLDRAIDNEGRMYFFTRLEDLANTEELCRALFAQAPAPLNTGADLVCPNATLVDLFALLNVLGGLS